MTMKKNNEGIKERLLRARALSDDELEQVSGGNDTIITYNPSDTNYANEYHSNCNPCEWNSSDAHPGKAYPGNGNPGNGNPGNVNGEQIGWP